MLLRLALFSAFLSTGVTVAGDWPSFRGPNRDGVSAETGLLKEWPAEGPKQLWKATNLGFGFGTPSFADGKIFGVGTRGGKDGVWALNESDAKELWFTPFADATKVRSQTNGPGSTPTYAEGKLFTVSINGTLVCMDATTGKELWKKSYLKDFGGEVPAWGYNETVLVDGETVICAPCGSKAALAALSVNDGKVIWRTEIKAGGGGGYSSAIKANFNNKPMYVCLTGDQAGIVGVDAATGKVLWQYTGKAATGSVAQIPIPVIKDDLVWVSCSYSGGAALLQIVPKGTDAFEAKELKSYKKPDLNNHHGGMVLVDGHIYFGHDQNGGSPVCVEMKTGDIKWGPIKSPAGAQKSAAVLFADGLLYFRYENGMLVLIKPDPTDLKVVSSFKLPTPDQRSNPQSWPHPVIVNGKLYIRDQTAMYCYDVKAK